MKKISDLALRVEEAAETEDRIGKLFSYPTPEEQEAKNPGCRKCESAFLTIGGPAVHALIYALSREEIEVLRDVLYQLLYDRGAKAREELIETMRELKDE